MEIGVKVYPDTAEGLIKHWEQIGSLVDFVEVSVRKPEEHPEQYLPLKEKAPLIIHSGILKKGEDVNLANIERRQRNFEVIRWSQRAADILEAEFIIFHTGYKEVGKEDVCRVDHLVDLLKSVNDSRILLETIQIVGWPERHVGIAHTLEGLCYVKERTNSRFLIDIGHASITAFYQDISEIEFIASLIEKLNPPYFHFCNNDGYDDRHWHLTDPRGEIRVEEILKLVPQNSKALLEVPVFGEDGKLHPLLLKDIELLRSYKK